MGGRSDSAVVRARYSSDVDGINRFKHFHTLLIFVLVSNSILRQASDYESGISKSSSFSNNSSIISNHTNDSPLENKKKPAVLVDLRSAVPQSLYKNKNKVSNITATTQLRMSERILKKVNDGLSDKLSIVGNKMQFHSSAESISIDKAGKGKPLISKLGKKRLKGLQYGMKSFSSDNINDGVLKGDNEVNFEKGYNGHLSLKIVNNVSISTQTEIIKNKRVKKEPRIMVDNSEINVRSKDQPRIEIESVIIADEITTFSSSRIDNKLSKASQTINHRLMSVDKKSLTDMNEVRNIL
uniref:Uncharacterized protein n=1 Tax=Rhabditophanes sp. KR3021 TaxID=114890 RepID=A0AC35U749_9BILA